MEIALPNKLEGAPEIATSFSELPDAYVWPEADRPTVEYNSFEDLDFPVVDMNSRLCSPHKDERPLILELIASACEQWGFFYLHDHGIATELLNKVQELGFELFLLPLDKKMRAHRNVNGGFVGYGQARIAKFFDSLLWSEGFTIGAPNGCFNQLINKIWQMGPAKEICACFTEYDNAMRKLAFEIARLVILSLGVDLDNFKSKQFCLDDAQGLLQLNYYPLCPEPLKTMGLPAHTDSTFLTILHHGNTGGLQILRNGKWTGLPPLQDTFIVHVGDLLQILSNGRYKSVMHRAVVNKDTSRLSIAYLYGPPLTATIQPICELLDTEHPQLYRSLTWNEYLQAKALHFRGTLKHFSSTQDSS